MNYVDGYLLPVPRRNLKEYTAMARLAGAVWREHGALDYKECVGDDLAIPGFTRFTKAAGAARTDCVIFAFVVFKSKAHRDAVNKRVMADPRIKEMCEMQKMPFDCRKMAYGGFRVIVDAAPKRAAARRK